MENTMSIDTIKIQVCICGNIQSIQYIDLFISIIFNESRKSQSDSPYRIGSHFGFCDDSKLSIFAGLKKKIQRTFFIKRFLVKPCYYFLTKIQSRLYSISLVISRACWQLSFFLIHQIDLTIGQSN